MKHLAIIATTIILLFTSCNRDGGEKSVFDYIPAESSTVARINVDAILKNSGCRIRDGKVTLSPSMEFFLEMGSPRQQELFTSLTELYPIIDMEQMMVTDFNGVPVALSLVKNEDALEQYLEENGVETELEGRTFYVTSSMALAEEDGVALIAESPEVLSSILTASEKSSVAAHPELTELFADTEPTITVCSLIETKLTRRERQEGKEPGYSTLLLTADLNEHSLEMQLSMMNNENLPVSITEFIPPVDPDILTSIPSGAQAVVVMGENPDLNGLLNTIAPPLASLLSESSQMMLISEFISGSFMVSATPAATGQFLRELTPPAWNLTATTTNADKNLTSILSALALFSNSNSPGNTTEEEGQLSYRITPELSLFILSDESLLTLSTDFIRKKENLADYTSMFEGASFGAVINIPYNSETMRAFNLPYGPNVILTGRDDTIYLRIGLNGSKKSLLEALSETLQAAR